MRKPVLIALFTLCLATVSLQAQQATRPPERRFSYGLFAGVNHTGAYLPTSLTRQVNPLAGVDLQYHLTPRSSLHLQPSWTQVSSDNAKSQLYAGASYALRLAMLKVPVLYRYYIGENRKLFFVQAGGSYNLLTNSNFRQEYYVQCFVGPCPPVLALNGAASNKSAISGIAGLGFNIELQRVSIPITFQYERSITSYLFPSQFDAPPTAVKFDTFSLTTGVNF
jgi:hypothetical protein